MGLWVGLTLLATGCQPWDYQVLRYYAGLETPPQASESAAPPSVRTTPDSLPPRDEVPPSEMPPPEEDDFGKKSPPPSQNPSDQKGKKPPKEHKPPKDQEPTPGPTPTPTPTATPPASVPQEGVPRSPGDQAALGPECRSARSGALCLGLKYAIYARAELEMEEAMDQALENLEGVNAVWASCDVQFQIDRFVWVDPAQYRLPSRTAHLRDLDGIRERLADPDTLLVVTTGPWDRSGELGRGRADAWTRMPGGSTHGAVLRSRVWDSVNLIAHELGHYLGLGHSERASSVMHPVVGEGSSGLSRRQCDRARWFAERTWQSMLRTSEASNLP